MENSKDDMFPKVQKAVNQYSTKASLFATMMGSSVAMLIAVALDKPLLSLGIIPAIVTGLYVKLYQINFQRQYNQVINAA